MRTSPTSAWSRLAAITFLLLIGYLLACRPSWSPDGSQVVYPALRDGLAAIARYNVETGKNELLLETGNTKGSAVAQFTPDGRSIVSLTSKKGDDKKLTVTVTPTNDDGKPHAFELAVEDATHNMIIPPVIDGRTLFLSGKAIRSLDIDTGETRQAAANAFHEVVLAPCGDKICYIARTDATDERQWELGMFDPETMQTTRRFAAPDGGWRVMPMPAFTSDGKRVAIPAERGKDEVTQAAILIFHDDKLENALELGSGETTGIGALAWANDDVTLFATVARRDEHDHHAYSLYETTFSGSVTRETSLFSHPPERNSMKPMPFVLQLAQSPDGSKYAMTTAFLSQLTAEEHGLLLVDVSGKERKVVRVPFPSE